MKKSIIKSLPKLKRNKNEAITRRRYYEELEVINTKGPLVIRYLGRVKQTFDRAIAEHPNTSVFCGLLRFPGWMTDEQIDEQGSHVISRFFESLAAKIDADMNRKLRLGDFDQYESQGVDYPYTRMRYIWARENNKKSNKHHYHFVILLNANLYASLGNYGHLEGCLAALIKQAWASALGFDTSWTNGAVSFPANPVYILESGNLNGMTIVYGYEVAFRRVSYLAKSSSKNYGNNKRHFDCSRI